MPLSPNAIEQVFLYRGKPDPVGDFENLVAANVERELHRYGVNRLLERVVKRHRHCHGRVGRVLDDLLEIGIDTLEPIEPPPQGDIALRELLARVAGRICLMGHIQDQDFYRAPPGGMRQRVRQIAETVAPTDRYIMMPTCTPFQSPLSDRYAAAYAEWIAAAAELLP